MSSLSCAKHPHQPVVGVCASCLKEKLALCMSNLEKSGATGEAESEAFGSTIIVSEGIDNGSSILRDTGKSTLSCYLENNQRDSSDCSVHAASHRRAISSDAIYQRNSLYTSGPYAMGSDMKGASYTKESSTLSDGHGKQRPFCCFSASFSKRDHKQKADCREGSIAPQRICTQETAYEGTCHQYDSSCTHSFSSEAPSWEHLAPFCKKPTRYPSLLTSQTWTRSPLKLLPLLNSPDSTRPPFMLSPRQLCPQSKSSPFKLHPSRSSPRSPLKLPPLQIYPRSPLKHPSLLSAEPITGSDENVQGGIISAQIEADQIRGHGVPSKKKEIWFGFFLRNKCVVRIRGHFAKKKKQKDTGSGRTSSARNSDSCRHSQSCYSSQDREKSGLPKPKPPVWEENPL